MGQSIRTSSPARYAYRNCRRARCLCAQAAVEQATKYFEPTPTLESREALKIIADAGEPALPVPRQFLVDDRYSQRQREIIAALAKAGGLPVAQEFVEIVERELAFWQAKAAFLPGDWQTRESDFDKSELRILNDRISYLGHVLSSLKTLEYEGSREVVTALRDYWAFEPQLTEIGRVTDMSQVVLDALDQPAR